MQSRDYDFRGAALADYVDAHLWYQRRSLAAAARFEEAVARALQLILEGPDRWQRVELGCRQIRLRGFPYFLVYGPDVRPIPIIAVAHTSRERGYWHNRVPDQ